MNLPRRAASALILWIGIAGWNDLPSQPTPPPAGESKPARPDDPLGRSTPRGSVLGFLNVARKGDWEAAVQYLNARPRGASNQELARQLFTVLNRRLPARLNEISDQPEGAASFPSKPNLDLVGTIEMSDYSVDILVERVNRGKEGFIWLFSRETLNSIPDLYPEIEEVGVRRWLPEILFDFKIFQISLFHWLALFVGLPTLYAVGGILNRLARALVDRIRGNRSESTVVPRLFSPAGRLLLMALVIRWSLYKADLPLLARQFWSSIAYFLTVAGCVWLLILLNGRIEARLQKRLYRTERAGRISFLHFARRTADGLLIIGGVLISIYYFGLNPTAALAGLGVGGIAVALAAQKTLENVIGGISIVFDHSVHVGETLKASGVLGTVEDIGLRSTRIRTLDRTVVYVPNGQLANLVLENFSRRDKFWLHQNLNLPFETSLPKLKSLHERVSHLLLNHPCVEAESVRVSMLNIGASAFELEIFAYVLAHDWPHFLEVKEELLMETMNLVAETGTRIALPSQAMVLEEAPDRAAPKTRPHNGARSGKRRNSPPHS